MTYIFIFHGRSAISLWRFLPANRNPWSPATQGHAPGARARTPVQVSARSPGRSRPSRPHPGAAARTPAGSKHGSRSSQTAAAHFRVRDRCPHGADARVPGRAEAGGERSHPAGEVGAGEGRYLVPRRGRPRAAPLAAAAGGWRRRRRGAAAPASASAAAAAARPPAPGAARRGARRCPA